MIILPPPPDGLEEAPGLVETVQVPPVQLVARPATRGLWVDTSWPLTQHVCAALVAAGYKGVFRTLPLPGNSSAGDLSALEARLICSSGLELGVYQHVRGTKAGGFLWKPSQCNARADAQAAAAHAKLCGLPAAMHLYQDLEGVDDTATATQLYTEAWSNEMVLAEFLAGLYIGFRSQLTPAELYVIPRVTSYWGAPGYGLSVAIRGCAVKQRSAAVTVAGVQFDEDDVDTDRLGDVPVICAAA